MTQDSLTDSAERAEPPAGAPAPLGFGDLAARGANDWWRYAVAFALVMFGGLVLVVAAATGLSAAGWGGVLARIAVPQALAESAFAERTIGFLFLVWGIVAFLPVMRVVLPWIHKRPWRSFLTAASRFRWRLAGWSFLVITALGLLALALQLVVAPDEVEVRAPDAHYWITAAIGLAVLPAQVLTEEVFFRGYLFQLVGRLTRLAVFRVAVPAVLFTIAHLSNPETSHDLVWSVAIYAAAAAYLGILVQCTQGLEASLGLHLGSNLFVLLISSPSVSVFPSHAIVSDIDSDFRSGLIVTIISFFVHYLLVGRRAKFVVS